MTGDQKRRIFSEIVAKIEANFDQQAKARDLPLLTDELKKVIEVDYSDGTKLQVPRWLVEYRGHDLANIIDGVFERKITSGTLLDVHKKLRIVPTELLDTMRSIAKYPGIAVGGDHASVAGPYRIGAGQALMF